MEGYNGWTNYETWLVNLHLTNDQGSANYLEELVRDASSLGRAADSIKEWVEEITIERWDLSGLASDLMGAAISEVNFYEIAEAQQSAIQELEEEEEEEAEEDDDEE